MSIEDLSLSKEDYEIIEDLAAANYLPSQIAMYMDFNLKDFMYEFTKENSLVKYHYDKGILVAEFEINQKLLENAKSGNITAGQEFKKATERTKIENLKRQIFFGET